jgi:hypothetical protein
MTGWDVVLVIIDVSKYLITCILFGPLELKVTAHVRPKLRTQRNSATPEKTQQRCETVQSCRATLYYLVNLMRNVNFRTKSLNSTTNPSQCHVTYRVTLAP